MISPQPTGAASLDVRQRYLRQRRARTGMERAATIGWVTMSALLLWLFIAGVSGLGH